MTTNTRRSRRIGDQVTPHAGLRRALGEFAAVTVRQSHVDPITTEIVRMRCAEHHDCGT